MIASSVQDYRQCQGLSSSLKSLITRALDSAKIHPEEGRYPLEGDQAFVLISSPFTEPSDVRLAEYHHRYLDVQILLEGREKLGYGLNLVSAEPDGEYSEAKDSAFCHTISNEQFLIFAPGDMAVFFPREYHRPLCAVNDTPVQIKKLVLKVDVNLIR